MCPKVIWRSLEIQSKEVKDNPDLLKSLCSNVQKLSDSEKSLTQEYLWTQIRVAGPMLLPEMQNYRPSQPQQAESPVCLAALWEAGISEESKRTLGQQVELRGCGLWCFQRYGMDANYRVISVTAFTITDHACTTAMIMFPYYYWKIRFRCITKLQIICWVIIYTST